MRRERTITFKGTACVFLFKAVVHRPSRGGDLNGLGLGMMGKASAIIRITLAMLQGHKVLRAGGLM